MDGTELSPALERVAASVVETQSKRHQLEDELKAAVAAVAALKAHSTALESSVLDLRRQLEVTLAAKAQEDSALAELATRRQAALGRLDAIAKDIETFLGERDRTTAASAAQIDESRSRLVAVEADISATKDTLASLQRDAGTLREAVTHVRQIADAADQQLAEIQSKARDLDTAADAMAAKVCRSAEDIEQAEKSRQNIVAASDQMRSVGAALEARKREAKEAADGMAQLVRESEQQAAALGKQLEKIAQLCAGSMHADGVNQAGAYAQTDPPSQIAPPARPEQFVNTLAVLELLASLGFVDGADAQAAVELLNSGDVDRFVRSLWSRAMGGPAPGPYRLIIAQALSESGDAKAALTFFNKAIEGRQVDPFTTYLTAVALLRMKRYVDALRIAQTMGRTRLGKVLARNIEALHLQSDGRFDEAENKLAEALATPGYPKLHYNETMYNLARLAERRGDTRSAIAWSEKLRTGDISYRNIAVHIESKKVGAQTG